METSDNLGIVQTDEKEIHYQLLVRSLDEFKAEELKDVLIRLCRLLDEQAFSYQVSGAYPAWKYQEHSRMREVSVAAYRELYREDPIVETIHAGLECGILQGKKPDLDSISMGPQMYDIHSCKERLDIASTQRTWELIKAILKRLLVL